MSVAAGIDALAGSVPRQADGIVDEATATIKKLTATVAQQKAVIATLVEAAEKRLERPSDDSAFGRWEQNLVLNSEVENRTRRIRAAERLLRSVVDSLEGSMVILNQLGFVMGANRHWGDYTQRLGWAGDEGKVGSDFFALVSRLGQDLAIPLEARLREVLAGQPNSVAIKGSLQIGGSVEDVVVRIHPVLDHDDARAVVTMIDITAATKIQQELRRITEQAQLTALVAEHTDNSAMIMDVDGRIEWVNEAFCRTNGFQHEEVVGRTRRELMQGSPLISAPAFQEFEEAVTAGHGLDLEMQLVAKDRRTYWAHMQVQPIMVDDRAVRFVALEWDITRQRDVLEQLRAATEQEHLLADELRADKALLGDVLGSIPHLVYWKDRNLRFAGVNAAFLALRCLPDPETVLGRTEADLATPDDLSAALASIEPQVLHTGQAVENQRIVFTGQDGPGRSLLLSVLPQVDDDGHVHGVIGVAADVTHVATLEQQLSQATRLESIGQLAAGIAHEINTPVQYVSDNTRFLAETFGDVLTALRAVEGIAATPGPQGEALQQLLSAVDLDFLAEEIPSALAQSQEGLGRVAQIVRAMKDFSHPGQGRVDADLNRALESTAQVSRSEWRYAADLKLDLDPAVGMVACFEGELKQVLLNIVVNAAQAISAERERTCQEALGSIVMRTRQLERSVQITVTDDGPGIPEAIQRKVFDPFFTTKPVGKGTGQGLSMAYAVIVHQHGGTLTLDSTPGAGATFTIDLPYDVPPS